MISLGPSIAQMVKELIFGNLLPDLEIYPKYYLFGPLLQEISYESLGHLTYELAQALFQDLSHINYSQIQVCSCISTSLL